MEQVVVTHVVQQGPHAAGFFGIEGTEVQDMLAELDVFTIHQFGVASLRASRLRYGLVARLIRSGFMEQVLSGEEVVDDGLGSNEGVGVSYVLDVFNEHIRAWGIANAGQKGLGGVK